MENWPSAHHPPDPINESERISMFFRHEDGHDVLDIYTTHFDLLGEQLTNMDQTVYVDDIDPLYEGLTGRDTLPLRSWHVPKNLPPLH